MHLRRLWLIAGFALLMSAPEVCAAERDGGSGSSISLPPLAEARTAGRLTSSYLQPVIAGKNPERPESSAGTIPDFVGQIAPVLKASCVACHGPEKQKGNFRIDTLNPDLGKGGDSVRWLEVFDVVSNGEMPPDDSNVKMDDQARSRVVSWLASSLQAASQAKNGDAGTTSFRRMTRYEYSYALQDLTGLSYEFAELLPPESKSQDGFLNSAPLLHMTGMQFERYREIGLRALQKATVSGERPAMVHYAIAMQDLADEAKRDNNGGTGRVHIKLANNQLPVKNEFKPKSSLIVDPAALKVPAPSSTVIVMGPDQSLKLNLGESLPDEGVMRVRLRAGRTTTKPNEFIAVRLILSANTSNNANFSETVSRADVPVVAPASKPEFIQFDVPLSEITRNPFRKKGGSLGRPDEFLSLQVVSNVGRGPGGESLSVHADYLEIIAPYSEQWPPASHTGIFIASKNRKNEHVYAGEVLTNFMSRAWRRPVSAQEVKPYLLLYAKFRPGFSTFESAMLEVLSTALVAPEFLYLTQKTGADTAKPSNAAGMISDHELASRLSMFLWCSIPDQELLDLAKQGRLSDRRTITAQAKRLLADPRSARFVTAFVEQWLGLDALRNVSIDETRFKGSYDRTLKDAMRDEPNAFFDVVLRQNLSVLDFIHADYVVVNERLAKLYRIPDVYGPQFRRVSVDQSLNRGGLLTAAGLLAMNSDGKDSHPVKRGVWLLKRILNDPPPPAPPNVPEVDLTNPEIMKMTLKERIVDHRNKPACSSCHAKIDPWGIALENFDAIGAFRSQVNNKPVDATATLFNGQPLAGIDGLKRYLLVQRQDQFARAMVHKLTVFALGRPLSFADRRAIDGLTRSLRQADDRLGDLITLIVTSDLFRSP